MADRFELQIRGLDEANRRLQQLARDVPFVAAAALREEAEIEMTEAKERTPVKTGALKGSGRVEPVDGDILTLRLAFGNAAVGYALPVHEVTEVFHRVGQAKFLESVIVESAPHLPARVARRMSEFFGGPR